jgi:hypothetical protein
LVEEYLFHLSIFKAVCARGHHELLEANCLVRLFGYGGRCYFGWIIALSVRTGLVRTGLSVALCENISFVTSRLHRQISMLPIRRPGVCRIGGRERASEAIQECARSIR